MLNWLWYITVILSIWGAALGGVKVLGIGVITPFRIVILITRAVSYNKVRQKELDNKAQNI